MPRRSAPRRNRIYDPTELYEDGERVFRLIEHSSGRIDLAVVDSRGNSRPSGLIIAIETEGYLHRFGACNARMGLALDRDGRLKTYDEEYQMRQEQRTPAPPAPPGRNT